MRIDLDAGWTVEREGMPPTAVTLPHDAMIHERRDPHAASGPASGFYPGGRYTYRRTVVVPADWRDRHLTLRFEGSYRRTTVRLNGVVVGGRPSGYAEFLVPLDGHVRVGEDNALEVEVDNSEPGTRWYSGSGLYRRVTLLVEGPVRFAPDGIRFRTVAVGDPARVEVDVTALDDAGAGLDIRVELQREGTTVASGTGRVASGEPGTVALDVPSPALWSADAPNLHRLVVVVVAGGGTGGSVEQFQQVGIRTIAVDARRGLRINGEPTLLRGGCLHHDNGVLGAATFRDAEFRRVRLLKQVGFNAIRTGHTPISRDLLDACDEIGMFVMDELTDVWLRPKGVNDSAHDFLAWWRRDLESMIAKDRNHASVILYSLGNEIGETATREGVAVGRDMADACRALDPTRPVTSGINPFLNALASAGIGLLNFGGEVASDDPAERQRQARDAAKKAAAKARRQAKGRDEVPALANSTLINVLMNTLNDRVLNHPRLPRFDSATREIFATLDVAGYNYGVGQYELHAQRYPDRVMVGTETNPKDIVRNWNLVEALPSLIGDFMWTATDYLGEAGIGSWTYGAERVGLIKPYPWLTADCGAIDLIGTTSAAGLLAQAAWGRQEPSIVVRPPYRVGEKTVRTNWRGTDAIPSWTWAGSEHRTTEILVYSAADAVELLLNGVSLGRLPAGPEHGCTAAFPVRYEPGELVAVALSAGGVEVGRTSLRTAGPDVKLRLAADRGYLTVGEQDLAFVTVRLEDGNGVAIPASVPVTATVEGAGTLAGFGSADPKPPHGFTSGISRTFHGEALAVVRAGRDPGGVSITVTSDGYGAETLILDVLRATAAEPTGVR